MRKEKKKLVTKVKELKQYIGDLNETDGNCNKENPTLMNQHSKSKLIGSSMHHQNLDDDIIVPANISIIRSKPSKHLNTVSSRDKLLPFQIYHSNKMSKHSYHSRNYTKGDFDESSTQLPSMLPSILKNNSISEEGEENGSRLFNVAELEADYVNDNNWS